LGPAADCTSPRTSPRPTPARLHEFIERHSFGLLVSPVGGEPFATHLPFLLDRTAAPHGTLIGHLARANPHWRGLAGRTALAVFSGPHAFISPSWYEAENVVPTWNYAAVHATGPVELVEGHDDLLAIVQQSIAVYEAGMPRPWALDPAGPSVDRLLGQIVGFRLRVERLEGKWKMSQNHPADRRERRSSGRFEAQGGEDAVAVAGMIRATLPAGDRPPQGRVTDGDPHPGDPGVR